MQSANYGWRQIIQDWKNASYFGVLNYSFANKYILDATIRRKGLQDFLRENASEPFGLLGQDGIFIKENFIPKFLMN